MHDVSLSVARVAQMEALLSRKACPAARQYSITTDEIARIESRATVAVGGSEGCRGRGRDVQEIYR